MQIVLSVEPGETQNQRMDKMFGMLNDQLFRQMNVWIIR